MPRNYSKRLIASCIALAVVAWAPAQQALATPVAQAAASKVNPAFEKWSDTFAQQMVRLSPEFATSAQYFSGAEQNALDRQLAPTTQAQRDKRDALARTALPKLERFLAGPLGAAQRESALTMRWALEQTVAGKRFEDHHFLFSQMAGAHSSLINFFNDTHPLRRAADVETYLARLEQAGPRMREATALAQAAAERKLIPPRFVLERSQGQIDTFLKPAARENVLVQGFEARLAKVPDMTPEARAAAVARATAIVGSSVVPAFQGIQAFMAELHPRTTDEAGVSRLPEGSAYYKQALAKWTGTNLSADQIHTIGLREVARIEKEMDRHLRALGYTEGTIQARMLALDKTFQPTGSADPRPAIIGRYTDMVRDAEQRSGALFNLKPRAPVEVRREPPLTEASVAAKYTRPAPDGSLPGIFWVPLVGPHFDTIRMRSLAYHEAVPGHHFQVALQQEMKDLPKYRSSRLFDGGSVYVEGWALYAERLAVEQNWYEGDVPGLLGALGSELFRARRLVVDTGLHSKGWTRQQAIDYGISQQEVDRYVSWPGQACSYMIGMLRILELREQAKASLGEKFSLPGFHDVVLRSGSVPMDVVARSVDQWVKDVNAKK